jgi:hypothetical protein
MRRCVRCVSCVRPLRVAALSIARMSPHRRR